MKGDSNMKRFAYFNQMFKEDKDLERQTKEILITKISDTKEISTMDLNGLRDSIRNWLNEESEVEQ